MLSYILVNNSSLNEQWIKQIAHLEQSIFNQYEAYSESNLRSMYLDQEQYGFIIVLVDQDVAAYLIYLKTLDHNEIMKIAVKEQYRRNSLGTVLLDQLKQENKTILLEVAANNTIAINFYLKNGFIKDSVRKHYYANDVDALLLSYKN
ncbi:hypothetical protein JM47_01520 [Ureaplasma diversum]|uniref:N-acetyltransferase domain-containing protein n=1 Tax=Ureaplasma diversum TaxID=42094 RepID=A0A0C5RPC0_9BACT|nr:N-acetyltransferase [Ureaplasma diversum]AJQ45289.1 hypothetical protein JM47_01520 [Ureaplasma diversum]